MQVSQFDRRACMTLLGSAAAWPLAARAQQAPMPVIGFLNPLGQDAADAERMRAFRQGLRDVGFVEGENVTIAYQWADNRVDRLSVLAADLVRRQVNVIAAIGGATAAFAAKAETTTIPIVFAVAQDPVKLGLIGNLDRPGTNLTGVYIAAEATGRRLALLKELLPNATRIGVLLDPSNAANVASTLRDLEMAARSSSLQLKVMNASSGREVEAAFATFATEKPDALFVGPFSIERRVQLALLAMQQKIPVSYPWRDFAEAGGLMSYGPSLRDAFRQAGIQTARVLRGDKPASLPVVQTSKFELVINAMTARLLGITVPTSLLSHADEVLE